MACQIIMSIPFLLALNLGLTKGEDNKENVFLLGDKVPIIRSGKQHHYYNLEWSDFWYNVVLDGETLRD